MKNAKLIVKMLPGNKVQLAGHNGFTVSDAATVAAALLDSVLDAELDHEDMLEIERLLAEVKNRIEEKARGMYENPKNESGESEDRR